MISGTPSVFIMAMLGKTFRVWACGALLAAAALAVAEGTIQLSAFPNVRVADGRSTITITAEVRDQNGSNVADGTEVVFESSIGIFRENLLRSQNGIVRSVLQAPSVPGIAVVRARALRVNATAQIEVEFVKDKSQLSSATDYIEVAAPSPMLCSPEDRIIQAEDPKGRVYVRYRDVRIDAAEVQVAITSYEVRARRATLTVDGKSRYFEDLNYKLNARRGTGTTEHEVDSLRLVAAMPYVLHEVVRRKRLGLVDLASDGSLTAREIPAVGLFTFQDISAAPSHIEARKAIAFPTREVQFQQARVLVAGRTVFRVPMFQLPMSATGRPLTEQFLNVSNNQLLVNYPHYLSLGPGQTSLLRFRYGNSYGVGPGGTGGTYLDYELKWNKGSEMDGGLMVRNIGRSDWGVSVRQLWSTDERTTITAQLDTPAHRSLLGNVAISRDLGGLQANLTGSYSRSLQGSQFERNGVSLVVERHPTKLGFIPARLYLGGVASVDRYSSELVSDSDQRYGLRARTVSDPIRLWRGGTLNLSYNLARFHNDDTGALLTHEGSATLTSQFFGNTYFQTTYDYVDDGFSSNFLGRHRLTAETYANYGALSGRLMMSRSLDADRLFTSANLDYRLSRLWRLNYSYTLDRFDEDAFTNQSFILAYRLGIREFGLSYSTRTKRLGIELLGTVID